MKLATWNVNSLVARMPRVLDLLEQHQPDLLFMQETKTEPGAFPLLELEAAGYRALHHSTGRWAGVALLARGEVIEVCAGLAGEPSRDEARWLEADVDGMRAVSDPIFPGPSLAAATWGSPHRRALDDGVLRDRELAQLFVEETGSVGPGSMVYRSTGSASTVQLWVFSDLMLTAAWSMAAVEGEPTPRERVAAALTEQVRLLRRAVRGEAPRVKADIAFTGIVLEDGKSLKLPFGILRPLRDHERRLAPPMLEGQLSHTTESGETITASYAGDVILETDMAYRIAVKRMAQGPELREWPSELRDFELLEAKVESLRLAALLGSDPDAPISVVPTWRRVFDPLAPGPLLSWSDPRQGPGMLPRRLSSADADVLARTTRLVHDKRHARIDVAVRKSISATAVRTDPADSILDCVIAWENLLGSRQGEPTLRISAALAWLLGKDAATREAYRAEATKLYGLRSDIVHGNRVIPPIEAAQGAMRARQLTLAVLSKLFRERTDILTLRDGDARSRALIMGA